MADDLHGLYFGEPTTSSGSWLRSDSLLGGPDNTSTAQLEPSHEIRPPSNTPVGRPALIAEDDDLIDFGQHTIQRPIPNVTITKVDRLEAETQAGRVEELVMINHGPPSANPLLNADPPTVNRPLFRSQSPVRPNRHLSPGQTVTRPVRPAPPAPVHILDEDYHAETANNPEACDDCQNTGCQLDYCNVCKNNLCTQCWNNQLVHKQGKLGPGGIPHEKTEISTARKVNQVLEPEFSSDDRAQMHMADERNSWFGVLRTGTRARLVDYGRYTALMAALKEERRISPSSFNSEGMVDTCYPAIASFVGETGAGKSTVVKLLIDLNAPKDEPNASPVVGASGVSASTSEDVHLYHDPKTSRNDSPILFADCEGLNAKGNIPAAALSRPHGKDRSSNNAGFPTYEDTRNRFTLSEREIVWADSVEKKDREYAVMHLYPRILYTFSDVVVFVLRNPRVVESVVEHLVKWADAALEMTSNQPILPHAIIVLNASENDIDEKEWDVEVATKNLISSLSQVVFKNATFRKAARYWRGNGRQIDTVEELVLSYYSSLKVVRIPTIGRPNLFRAQTEKLYKAIKQACTEAKARKQQLRMLLHANELQPYLQFALDHFASTLTTPFDFVQASFIWSPIPQDFGGNILKLAINTMNLWQNELPGEMIFLELSFMVASCIMLDSARSEIRGSERDIFPRYIQHLNAALENFCDRHWPCEYEKPGKGIRCVNVRSGHGSKGHQGKDGKVLAAGEYQCSFSYETYMKKFQSNVWENFCVLFNRLRETSSKKTEKSVAGKIHKQYASTFVRRTTRERPETMNSHTGCFCCLFGHAEHVLPWCGHVICTACLKSYGTLYPTEDRVEISSCPLDGVVAQTPWTVFLKPATAGVRILTLDGGGIRGIAELEVLKRLEVALGGFIGIQQLFDLVVGTSTGGLIALGLCVNNWTVDACIKQFQTLCNQAFTRRPFSTFPGMSWAIDNFNYSKYQTAPLVEALQTAFTRDESLFGGTKQYYASKSVLKVAVTSASTTGSAVVFANYSRLPGDGIYTFPRPETADVEMKVWEAARATSAAPTFFKPLWHKASNQTYMDGAIYHNNPVEVADHERKLIWPEIQAREPDVVVSIGSGINSRSTMPPPPRATNRPRPGIIGHMKHLAKLATDCIASSLDSQRIWDNFYNGKSSLDTGRYIRLNPQLPGDPPKLDDVAQMATLQGQVRFLMTSNTQVKALAARLVAALFYWDPATPDDSPEGLHVGGHIRCRSSLRGNEISALGKFIQSHSRRHSAAEFVVKEKGSSDTIRVIPIDNEVINTMTLRKTFEIKYFDIPVSHEAAIVSINLSLTPDEDEGFPISGFPRTMLQSKKADIVDGSRAAPSNPSRWVTRTLSQRQRWDPPAKSECTLGKNSILTYLSAGDILCDAGHELAAPGRIARRNNFSAAPLFEHPTPRIVISPPRPDSPPSPNLTMNWESAATLSDGSVSRRHSVTLSDGPEFVELDASSDSHSAYELE